MNPASPYESNAYELRILSGLHTGARLAFTESLLIGGALEDDDVCDVALLDELLTGRQLRIDLLTDTNTPIRWLWQWLDETIPAAPLALDAIQWFDELAITVSAFSTAWPNKPDIIATALPSNLNEMTASERAPGTVDNGSIDGGTPKSIDPDNDVDATSFEALVNGDGSNAALFALPNAATVAAPKKKKMSAAGVVLIVVSSILLLAMIAALVFVLSRPHEHAPLTAPVKQSISNQSAAAVTHVLKSLGMDGTLRVGKTLDGQTAVVGWVLDANQRDTLAMALAQLSPMPAMRVSVESDAVATAQAMANGMGRFLTAQGNGGAGTISIVGVMEQDGDIAASVEALRQSFAQQLPEATLHDEGIVNREGMADVLRGALAKAGFSKARVWWSAAGLEAVAPTGADARHFQAVLNAMQQQYGARVPLLARLGEASTPLVPSVLPFNITSVTGGALPTVTVDGVHRLLPGGVFKGFRLVSVTDAEIVFDGPQRVTVAR